MFFETSTISWKSSLKPPVDDFLIPVLYIPTFPNSGLLCCPTQFFHTFFSEQKQDLFGTFFCCSGTYIFSSNVKQFLLRTISQSQFGQLLVLNNIEWSWRNFIALFLVGAFRRKRRLLQWLFLETNELTDFIGFISWLALTLTATLLPLALDIEVN